MYSQSQMRAFLEKKANIAKQLKEVKAAADARALRALRALKPASVRPQDNTSLVPEAPNTSAAPPPVENGHTARSKMPLATKNKTAAYNKPVNGSSLKRRADDIYDAPPPKRHRYEHRASGERYQGTAARPLANVFPIPKGGSGTQGKVRDNGPLGARTPLSALRSRNQAQGQKHKTQIDFPSSLVKKRRAENDLDENTAKKQRRSCSPSLCLAPTQSQDARKAVLKRARPTPNTGFFSSLYPKNSKLKASAGHAIVTTEIIRIPISLPDVEVMNAKHNARISTEAIAGKSKLPTPPKTPKEDAKDRRVEDIAAIKSAKRKNTSSDEVSQPNKRRSFDGKASGTKAETQRAEATGIHSHLNACYINSVVQVLANVPRMANHYRSLAGRVTPEVAEYLRKNEKDLPGSGNETRNTNKAKKQFEELLEANKPDIRLGAYLGVLLNELLGAEPSAKKPSSYVFAQACGVVLKNVMGEGYNGNDQRDCMEYLEKLLSRLRDEELEERTEKFEAPTLVEQLFGLLAVPHLKCQSCSRAWKINPETLFAFTTSMPHPHDPTKSLCITKCLDEYSIRDEVEVNCDDCGRISKASKWMELADLSPYVLVNVNRVDITDGNPKIMTPIGLPVSNMVTMKDGTAEVEYEAIGTLNHAGNSRECGHWTASVDIDGQWWYCSDHHVTRNPKPKDALISMVILRKSGWS